MTPYGEIHVSARTLALWHEMEPAGAVSITNVDKVAAALMFDFSAGLISKGLLDEKTSDWAKWFVVSQFIATSGELAAPGNIQRHWRPIHPVVRVSQ